MSFRNDQFVDFDVGENQQNPAYAAIAAGQANLPNLVAARAALIQQIGQLEDQLQAIRVSPSARTNTARAQAITEEYNRLQAERAPGAQAASGAGEKC